MRLDETSTFTYQEAEALVFALEKLLLELGVTIDVNSALGDIALAVMAVADRKGNPDIERDPRSHIRAVFGVAELARAVFAAQAHADFPRFIDHLRLLQGASGVQNLRSSPTDQATNKIFELLAAAAVLPCGTDIELDDPEKSTGKNPDVLISIGSTRWGIACKALHSLNPQSIFENIEKAVEQISSSPADTGLVLLSAKNVIPHEQYWPSLADIAPGGDAESFVAFSDPTEPFRTLRTQLRAIARSVVDYVGEGTMMKLFTASKALPAFALWAHTATGLETELGPVPMAVRQLYVEELAPISAEAQLALECLNHGLFGAPPVVRGATSRSAGGGRPLFFAANEKRKL